MTKVSSQPEGSPFTPRQVKLLKIGVAIMTALMILGIFALVYGMARQASRLGASQKPAATLVNKTPYLKTMDLGQGKLEGVQTSGDILVLHWRGDASDTVVLIDPRDGHELGRIQVPRR